MGFNSVAREMLHTNTGVNANSSHITLLSNTPTSYNYSGTQQKCKCLLRELIHCLTILTYTNPLKTHKNRKKNPICNTEHFYSHQCNLKVEMYFLGCLKQLHLTDQILSLYSTSTSPWNLPFYGLSGMLFIWSTNTPGAK